MDLIPTLLNISFAPLAVISLFFFLPPFLCLKLLLSTLRSLFKENVAGKVVLITDASSGIGEQPAYEYAKRGAYLALVARRLNRLRQVAATAEFLGSPEALVIHGDVTKVSDCRRFVEATVEHFGRLDHLVTKAGVAPVTMFESAPDITSLAPAMEINFWGSVYSSYFAIPHLSRSHGKIIVISSCASWLPAPRMAFYNASKAALVAMYENPRIEIGSEVGITIVTPGLIESEMTGGTFLNQQGRLEVDREMRDVQMNLMPVASTEECAKAIVNGACRGDKNLTEPAWYGAIFFWKVFIPETIEWINRFFLIRGSSGSERDTISWKILDLVNKIKESLVHTIGSIVEFPEVVAYPEAGNELHRVY